MKQTISRCDFHDAFVKHDRLTQFSYEARELMFEHLEQYEDQTGEELELDVIAICCDYSEESFGDIAKNYNIGLDHDDDEETQKQCVIDYLQYHTVYIGETKIGLVYQVF